MEKQSITKEKAQILLTDWAEKWSGKNVALWVAYDGGALATGWEGALKNCNNGSFQHTAGHTTHLVVPSQFEAIFHEEDERAAVLWLRKQVGRIALLEVGLGFEKVPNSIGSKFLN